jgi:sulfur-oxidizing protein SoxZ
MTARVQVPATAKRGDVIEIRIAIQHSMETGFRLDDGGRAIPKNVVNKLACRYNNVEIFRAEMGSGVAANPVLDFFTVADASGELVFDWIDDEGLTGSERVKLTVTG